MEDSISIKNAVLHILDNNTTMPVLSNQELELGGEISEFLEKHIQKGFDDNNLKQARFMEENNQVQNLCSFLAANPDQFLQASINMANLFFEIMTKHVDIVPADLLCCLFTFNNQPYFGVLKLNYKTGFTHYVEYGEETTANKIIRHQTLLPADGQKVDECAFIHLEDYSIRLIEKEYELNGEKDYYLSKLLLNCSTELSNNEKIKIINKVTKKINQKYFDEDFEKAAEVKKAVAESLEEASHIRVDTLVEKVYKNNIEIQNEYIEEIHKAGLEEKAIEIPEKLAEKKFMTHRIKTDNGIEINFPMSYFNNREKIEFINNPDGTISIMIKNVGRIMNK